MEECMVGSKRFGVMTILKRNEGVVQREMKLNVNWWVRNSETVSKMKLQDRDLFVHRQIGIAPIIACMMNSLNSIL